MDCDLRYVFGDDITFGKVVQDHVKPINYFDLSSCYIELLKVCNWRNLQLLTEKENGVERNKFPPKDEAAYNASWHGIETEKEAVKWRAMGGCECKVCVNKSC